MDFTWYIYYDGIKPFIPNGCFLRAGVDAQQYMCFTRSYTEFVNVGHIEGNSVVHILDRTKIRNDFAGLGLGGHTGGTYNTINILPITGSSQFIVLMSGTGGASNQTHVGGVRYKINSTSSLTVDGGFLLDGTEWNFSSYGVIGSVHTCAVIGSDLWAVLTGTGASISTRLCKVPISGTTNNLTLNSWSTDRTTALPWHYNFWNGLTTRRYSNMGTIINRGGGVIGVGAYVGVGELASDRSRSEEHTSELQSLRH